MANNEARIKILGEDPVVTAILKMSLPVMMGMIIQVLYNMVDTFFIGRMNDVNQLAAASLGFPVFMLFMSVGGVIGTGASSLISRYIGMKKIKEAGEIVALSVILNLAFAVVVTLLGLAFIDPLVRLLGATGGVFDATKDYLVPLIAGSAIILGNFSFGMILRAEGAAMRAMTGMIIGTVVNIILDPIMIFAMGLGIRGAAIATVIGNLVGLVWYLGSYAGHSLLTPVFDRACLKTANLRDVLVIGLPSGLNQGLMSVAGIVTNNLASAYGADALGGMGVSQRIFSIVILLLIGLAVGTQPLVGYNYGAKNRARVLAILKTGMIMAVSLGTALFVLMRLVGKPMVSAFTDLPEVVARGDWVLFAVSCSAPIIGVIMITMNSLQALGKARPSLLLSTGRQGLFYIPIVFLLNTLFGFNGLVFTQPLVDIFTAALAVVILRHTIRHDPILGKKAPEQAGTGFNDTDENGEKALQNESPI